MLRIFVVAVLVTGLIGCAQVPKESVELSTTVGRDIAEVHRSHREMAKLLFDRMRRDVNRFIDDVYTPYQIRFVMERQEQLARSGDANERKKSILLAINAAFKPEASPALQKNVLRGMAIMVQKIHDDIESMRRELLDPLDAQEAEALGAIDRAYQKIHYANSIVTGHLSSIAKVHEVQSELLEEIGVEKDLRKQVGQKLANASDRIGRIVDAAERADNKVDEAKKTANELKQAVEEIGKNVTGN